MAREGRVLSYRRKARAPGLVLDGGRHRRSRAGPRRLLARQLPAARGEDPAGAQRPPARLVEPGRGAARARRVPADARQPPPGLHGLGARLARRRAGAGGELVGHLSGRADPRAGGGARRLPAPARGGGGSGGAGGGARRRWRRSPRSFARPARPDPAAGGGAPAGGGGLGARPRPAAGPLLPRGLRPPDGRRSRRAAALYLPGLDIAADGWRGGDVALADLVRARAAADRPAARPLPRGGWGRWRWCSIPGGGGRGARGG